MLRSWMELLKNAKTYGRGIAVLSANQLYWNDKTYSLLVIQFLQFMYPSFKGENSQYHDFDEKWNNFSNKL